MPEFSYIIRTEDGSRKEGVIEASNLNDASDKLRLDNSTIVKVSERDTSFDFMGPFLDRLSLSVEKMKNRIPLSILVFFTRQLATMFSAGLTIERALFFLAKEEKHPKFKKILINIEQSIRKGLLLSDAFERHPSIFSNLFISLVRAGEVSGKLGETLDELAMYLETVEDTQRKVKSAMYYPVFILIFLAVTLFAVFTFIIPKFSDVYDTLGADLPRYTILLVDFGEWLQLNILFVFSIIFTVLISAWLFILTDRGRLIWDSLLLKLPIFGKLIEQNILSKFSKTFGILVSAGVPVLDSMHLVQKVVENRVYELELIKASNDIENGSNISTALKARDVFPPIMIQLISTGEETGEIDQLLLKASEFYTKQVNAIVDRLTAIIEPALIILVGVVIGAIIIITYLPIFQFGKALG
jgi:type IV pilus assembly protein PilC